jgi:hypothetical protein
MRGEADYGEYNPSDVLCGCCAEDILIPVSDYMGRPRDIVILVTGEQYIE